VTIYDEALGYEIAFSYRDVPDEIDAVLRLTGLTAPTSALELACGPGEHVVECGRRGMRAVALDLSSAMLARATANAAAAGVELTTINEDMRTFSGIEPVDLAFCMISSISHVTTLDEMIAHLESVRDTLVPGGRYLIEGAHPSDYLGASTVSTHWDTERDGVSVHLDWGADTDVIDPVSQITQIHVQLIVTRPDGAVESYASVEDDRFWTANEMVAAARLAGLEVLGQYGDFDGRALDAEGAWRMITVLGRS
jgi:SAM-dependent methyltransferase